MVHFRAVRKPSLGQFLGAFGDLKGEGFIAGVVAFEEGDLGLAVALLDVEGLEFAKGLVGSVGIEADGLVDAGDFQELLIGEGAVAEEFGIAN